MDTLIIPSIIAKTQEELDGMVNRVLGKARRVMLDVMDGVFVGNHSLDFDFHVPEGLEYEAHLMVANPLEWVEDSGHKVGIVIYQVETLDDVDGAIRDAKDKGLKVSLALSPETGIDAVLPHLKSLDAVLVMTVTPGTFCIEFIPGTLEKVSRLREIDPGIDIEVDGCMSPDHVKMAKEAGANVFDSGSYVMKSDDVAEAMARLGKAASG
jgi:ribulose-phosphate 3-epimerase